MNPMVNPPTLNVNRAMMQERIEEYLDKLGCTLWGKAYDVSYPEGRAAAAKAVTDLVAGALAGSDPKADAVHTTPVASA